MNDGKSNWEEDGELKLREARLKFRGSKKEDSGVEWGVETGFVSEESKVTTVSRRAEAHES